MIIENKNLSEDRITQNNVENKLPVRCVECDREMDHYITFTSPTNVNSDICWQCYNRNEKGFNTKRDFNRRSRSGLIPR